MSNSVQTVVSDGSLTLLDISFNYFDRTHVHVYFDNVEQTLGTTWAWVGTSDKKVQFSPAVSSGVVVKLQRATPLDAPRHVYSSPGNAPFNKATVDENFRQTLYAAQEAAEGANLEVFTRDVSAGNNKLTDLADAMLDGDAVSLKVLREYLPYGPAATSLNTRVAAEEAATVALQGDGGAGLVGYGASPLSAWLGKIVMATESRFGLSEANTGAQNLTAMQAFVSYLDANKVAGWIPSGTYEISGAGFRIPSNVTIHCDGKFSLVGTGSKCTLLNNTKYSNVYGLKIIVNAASQTALSIRGDAGYSELNNFFGLLIDSDALPASTVGIELDNAFSNFFYGARVLRVAKQVTFANAANANIFYGGELRSNNTLANGSNPIVHGVSCHGNAFIGTVIENQRAPIKMDGGELTLMGRCYLEAFYSPEAIQMNGGCLTLDGNYLNNVFVFVNGGSVLRYLNNDVDGASSNANYPFVQYRADVNTQLELRGNKALQAGAVIYRPREWYNGSAWAYRGIANRIEFVQMSPVRFQSRLASDAVDVTGDGTTYQLVWGGNEQFDDGSNMGAVFSAPENGLYQFELSMYVSGIVTASHDNITAKIVTSNRSYTVWFSGVDGVQSTGGQMIFRGTCFADMETGDSAYATMQVTGSSKVVDVLRGDAVNGFTTFSGFKVA